MSPKKKSKDLKYQDALNELEAIVGEVESESMDIDVLSDNIERALELISYCQNKLKDTENKIQKAFDKEDEQE